MHQILVSPEGPLDNIVFGELAPYNNLQEKNSSKGHRRGSPARLAAGDVRGVSPVFPPAPHQRCRCLYNYPNQTFQFRSRSIHLGRAPEPPCPQSTPQRSTSPRPVHQTPTIGPSDPTGFYSRTAVAARLGCRGGASCREVVAFWGPMCRRGIRLRPAVPTK